MNATNRNIPMSFEQEMNFTAFKLEFRIQSPQKDQLVLKPVEGKVIGNYEIEEGQSKVNTANLSSGMYILTFINQNKSFKLIKL